MTFTWLRRLLDPPFTGGRASPCAEELSRFELKWTFTVKKRSPDAVSQAAASGLRASVREEKARLVVDVVSDAGLPIYARPGPLIQVAGSFRWSMKLVDACMYAAWQRSTRRLHFESRSELKSLAYLPNLRQYLPLNQLGPSASGPAGRYHKTVESVVAPSTPLRPRSIQLSEIPGRHPKR